MRKYNKKNCTNKVRKEALDFLGNKMQLIGTHAHEWSIMRSNSSTGITLLTFASRPQAMKEFHKLEMK